MIPESMRVVEMSGAGGPEVLQLGTRAVPKPNSGQVLVRVTAAGVNGPDLMQRRGLYPPPLGASDLLGLEISGEVVAKGDWANLWRVGDEVCGLTDGGGYAEYCVVNESHCLPVPAGVSVRDAAGLPETFITVWSNLFHEEGSRRGRRCSCMEAPGESGRRRSSWGMRSGHGCSQPTARRSDAGFARRSGRTG